MTGCLSFRSQSYAEIARNYESQENYEAAIRAYLKHIAMRIDSSATGENPYFYYLLVGDDYLKLNNPSEAKIAYDTAKTNHVDSPLLVDRAKLLAKYYAKQNAFDQAINILNDYRELDQVSIDYEIDYIHKQMLEFEDNQTHK